MQNTFRSTSALEAIARNTLKAFNPDLLNGPPSAVPVDKLALWLGLCIKYQCLRNRLATALLMPTAQVKRAFYAKINTTQGPIATLAKLFEVSKQAMGIFMCDHYLLIDS